MRVQDLPSPGVLSNGYRLRVEAAKAISAAEVTASRTKAATAQASELRAFFKACANALAAIDATPASETA